MYVRGFGDCFSVGTERGNSSGKVMLSSSILRRTCACAQSEDRLKDGDGSTVIEEQERENKHLEELSTLFSSQGIQWEPKVQLLWCLLCTTFQIATCGCLPANGGENSSSEQLLVKVGNSRAEVLKHCSTREHLLRFEESNNSQPLDHGVAVEIHGQQMLLANHCLYPSSCFGSGRVLIDETLAERSVLGEDVCGGVKLLPYHRYSIAELVLPQYTPYGAFIHDQSFFSLRLEAEKKKLREGIRKPNATQCQREYSVFKAAARTGSKRTQFTTQKMLEVTNRNISKKLSFWPRSDLLSGQ